LSMSNTDPKPLSYSNLAKMVFILVPVLLYLSGAYLAIEVKDSLSATQDATREQFMFALESFSLRAGGIVLFIFGCIKIFLHKPSETTPKWMVKRQEV